MQKEKLITFGVVVFILLVAGAIIFFKSGGLTGFAVNNGVSADAAKWIGQHSTVYVQTGCSHCADQEALFGANWKYMNSVDCISSPENRQACSLAGIEYTPTWVINGQQYDGFQSIATLENLTGYQG